MSEISTHILDSVSGCSAAEIRVQLFRVFPGDQPETVFDVFSDGEGRVSQSVSVGEEQENFELIFHSADYFSSTATHSSANPNMKEVVVRFSMKDREKKYHIPLILSPHSYTVWWSE